MESSQEQGGMWSAFAAGRRGDPSPLLDQLGVFLRLLWFRRRSLLLLLIVSLAAAAAYHLSLPRYFRAVALLGKGGQGGSTGGVQPRNLPSTALARILQLPRTRGDLQELLAKRTPPQTLGELSYRASFESGVNSLSVEAMGSTPHQAREIANAVCDLLLQRNDAFLRRQIEAELTLLVKKVRRKSTALKKIADRIENFETTHGLRFASRRIQAGIEDASGVAQKILLNAAEVDDLRAEIKITTAEIQRRAKEHQLRIARWRAKRSQPSPPPKEVLALRRRRRALLLEFRPIHPRVRGIDRQISNLLDAHRDAEAKLEPERPVISEDSDRLRLTLAAQERKLHRLEERLQILREMDQKIRAELSALTRHAPTLLRWKTKWTQDSEELTALRRTISELEQAAAHPQGHYDVLESASVSRRTIAPFPLSSCLAIAAASWAVLAACAGLMDLRRRPINSSADSEACLGLPTVDATVLRAQPEQLTRAFFDGVIQATLRRAPELKSLGIIGVDSESDAESIWQHCGGAWSRLGARPTLFDLESEGVDEELGLPPLLSYWLGQRPSRRAVLLLPPLASGSNAAKLARRIDGLIVVVPARRYLASELRLWLRSLPGGRSRISTIILSGNPLPECAGIEQLVSSLDKLERSEEAPRERRSQLKPSGSRQP